MSPAVTVYGADSCRFTNRTRGQLDSLGVAYRFVDIEKTQARPSPYLVGRKQRTPTVAIEFNGASRRLICPGDWELETELIRCGLVAKRNTPPASRTVIRGARSILRQR